MTRYVALLRAVNVGGTGKLAMADLRAICAAAGFTRVETYIASGNVVFDSKVGATKVKALLHSQLAAHLGKPIGVVVRTEAEMAAVLKACPFTDMEPKHTYAIFLDAPPPSDALQRAVGRTDERLALGERETRPLPPRHGPLQAAYSREQRRHGSQYDHGRDAGGNGFESPRAELAF